MKHVEGIGQALWSNTGRTHTPVNRELVPVYRVGEAFRRGHCTWPQGAQFIFGAGGHELTIFRSAIHEDVLSAVRQGEAEFALIVDLPLIVLSYRFGRSIPWDDVPFSWHLQPVSWRVVPSVDPSTEARTLLWITLVGAEDGIIHAQRGLTLSPSFTRSLQNAIRTQALMPFDPEGCTSAISRIFLNHPGTINRLALAEARTLGNE